MSRIENPILSVLMPAYNAGAYIQEAIDSVLAQSFTNFELLVFNDGSTDNTLSVLKQYTDPRLKIFNQENMGLVNTLNKGLSLAKGKYVARFDADDICLPNRFQIELDFLESNPDYILVSGDVEYMDNVGDFIFNYKCALYEDAEIRSSGMKECPFIHSAIMYVRQMVLDAGGYNPLAINFEDHLLWKNLLPFGKMKNLKVNLIKVRFNAASVTVDAKWRGEEFNEIKQRSIQCGKVSVEDGIRIKEILAAQNFTTFKEAAYFTMIGKKYLWNNYNPKKARYNLKKAIGRMPWRKEPYMLFVLSFFPESFITFIYTKFK
jgi:glycosyltransferase involved in cell wall biosynthesis